MDILQGKEISRILIIYFWEIMREIVEYPKNIHLIRGNHEAEATNTVYGFLDECIERIVRECNDGNRAFKLINDFFSHLPLAALIEKKIFCVHGGIGSSVFTMKQITNIKRPVDMDCEYNYKVVKDLLWSDPTAHDSILGIGVNERGPHVVSFGPDRVNAFCERNDIDMIIRGHECVLDGFERFAQGKLITVFSATNYCGKFKNAGAILVIGRNLDVVPKLIHPLPPPISPSENVPDKAWIEVDRERPPTPIRGQRKPDFEQGSTS
ncbi:BnaC05g26750D [Brassica napus]|uniref:Serine/threonine-protein phosphatase n=1 Tax=Brassica napus TaxID=3708 RepID=A0A078F6M4_BRANA|nr:BnaC05g26750D [Brassica napus]